MLMLPPITWCFCFSLRFSSGRLLSLSVFWFGVGELLFRIWAYTHCRLLHPGACSGWHHRGSLIGGGISTNGPTSTRSQPRGDLQARNERRSGLRGQNDFL